MINNVYVKVILDVVELVRFPCNFVALQMVRNPWMSPQGLACIGTCILKVCKFFEIT